METKGPRPSRNLSENEFHRRVRAFCAERGISTNGFYAPLLNYLMALADEVERAAKADGKRVLTGEDMTEAMDRVLRKHKWGG